MLYFIKHFTVSAVANESNVQVVSLSNEEKPTLQKCVDPRGVYCEKFAAQWHIRVVRLIS